MSRTMGIEPITSARQAEILPLNYARAIRLNFKVELYYHSFAKVLDDVYVYTL